MDDTITTIRAELLRLDPSGETRADTDHSQHRWPSGVGVRIYAVGFEDEATRVDAGDALDVLSALPTGCPIGEGVDGSLWDALDELALVGHRAAMAYVAEHHGTREEGE